MADGDRRRGGREATRGGLAEGLGRILLELGYFGLALRD